MYIPRPFAVDDEAVRELLRHQGAADLVTLTDDGLTATVLPFVYDADAGEHGTLVGHMARANPQWRAAIRAEALVIVRGPDAYVSPSWYATKNEHHRVVPTWNYVTAHVYGHLVVHDDAAWIDAQIRRLTDLHEAEADRPWSVDHAPPEFIAQQVRAIVGVEVVITRIEAKFKLSQNQPPENRAGVIDGLISRDRPQDGAVAAAVRRYDPNAR